MKNNISTTSSVLLILIISVIAGLIYVEAQKGESIKIQNNFQAPVATVNLIGEKSAQEIEADFYKLELINQLLDTSVLDQVKNDIVPNEFDRL